ncbi:MAG TPA: RHS repeat-associated core domain-containing protein [Thermoanaerobaculia bacterium]|nr:RHS repeat-associated core domain-containing protein [Thermoanaerobaculia bacterium]
MTGRAMRRRPLARLLLPLCLLAAPALADVHPNTAPGFPAEQSFHVGDVDNVNLFNGSLTLTIPLGGSYPVNGGFAYGLKLVYNSTPWEFLTATGMHPTGQTFTRTFAVPQACSNAGLGWRVSLGRFDPPCQVPDQNDQLPGPIYQDENGTDHIFYPTLHPDDPEDVLPAGVDDVEYTRDGSYLRMKHYLTGVRDVEFPDGTVRKFDASGRLTQIRDPFANSLTVSYAVANQWILTDSQNRTQKVIFRTDLGAYPSGGVVDRIELTAFDGTPAVYQFGYTVQALGRACPHNDESLGSAVTVPLLLGVTFPDGSKYAAAFTDYITEVPVTPGGCTDHSGNLTGLTLPTLGRLAWTWQTYLFPTGSSQKPRNRLHSGVATRAMKNSGAANPLGTWTYQTVSVPPNELTTTVTDPLSHKTVHYFSVATDSAFIGWSRYDYSLPFTRNQTHNAAPGVDLNLSRQVYNTAGTLLRSEYVLYERDPAAAINTPPTTYNTNRRTTRSRTLFHDDPAGSWSGMTSSGFDGLGHYRQQDTEGNFPGSNVRSQLADYNPGRGTYIVNAAANTGSGYSALPASSPWVLETMASASTTENGVTAQTDFCYAAGSAAVTRRRVYRGALQGAQDLVTVFDLDGAGNPIREKSYGGDVQAGIGTGGLCALALPAAPEYQVDHTYAGGVRATSQYAGTNFKALDQTIHTATGLVSSSRDSAGLQTSYDYDDLGRLTFSKPQSGQGGWTQYVYSRAAAQTARVSILRRGNGNTAGTPLASELYVFDNFGRLVEDQRDVPGGISRRTTTYDGAGNKASVSELSAGAADTTRFQSFDPFGRPGTIRPPDGSAHDVTMTYQGVRQVARTVKIATAAGSETASTTTEVYDRHGRLLSVAEPSGGSGAAVTTTYGYDVGNRLASVSTLTQSRAFSFDRAGLLQSETHPEKGASGNGTVSYTRYDSRGHALRKADGPNVLIFTYDAAERLTEIREGGSAGLPLKEFIFAPVNGTGNWSKGKLAQATRYNYVTVGSTAFTVQVDEAYTYGGLDGRVSKRDTAFFVATPGAPLTARESFTQSFGYDALGLATSLAYPICTHAECAPAAPVFTDVPAGHPNQREIEALFQAGLTRGCVAGPPYSYCPASNVNRAEMATFLVLAATPGFMPAPCNVSSFADVNCATDWFAPWVEELYRRGLTGGCAVNPLRYCPASQVTRAEISAFLLRAREGIAYLPPPAACPTPWADVPCSHWAAGWMAEASRRGVVTGCASGFCPDQPFTRAQMAGYLDRGFDLPVAIDPKAARNATFAYNQGLLTGVSANGVSYGTLSYHPNLLVSQVAHGNGVMETQGNDPNQMRRPASLSASGPYATWSSGAYAYDGAGNVKTIGASAFTYDKVSRLVSASLFDGPTGGGTAKQQSYTFDAHGNLTTITTAGTTVRNIPASAGTNRLNAPGTAYDGAGNLTSWNGAAYEYDRFNQMTRMTSGSEDWFYLYTADDERIWSFSSTLSRWTLRDLGGKVLREYLTDARGWSVGTDYLYRDGLLLAAETQTGRRHFHLDHLGTPRLITRASGDRASYHVYYPFGEEATAFNQDSERMKFTGHERDLGSLAGAGDDLDYMHARHCSPVTGRFMSVDPALESADPLTPQSWNRYNYVQSNPLVYVDPTGELLVFAGGTANLNRLRKLVNDSLHGHELIINKNGTAQLVVNKVQGPASPEQAALAGALSAAINRPEVVRIGVESGAVDVLIGNYASGKIDIQDIGAIGSGPGVNPAAALAHEITEQTAKQVFQLTTSKEDAAIAHAFGTAAQNSASGFMRGRTNDDLFNYGTRTGYTLTEQAQGSRTMTVLFKWVNGNLVKVIRR